MNARRLEVLLDHLEAALSDEAVAIGQRDLDELERVIAQKGELIRGIAELQEKGGTSAEPSSELSHRWDCLRLKQDANASAFEKWTEENRGELADIRRATGQLRTILGPSGAVRSRSTPPLELWG